MATKKTAKKSTRKNPAVSVGDFMLEYPQKHERAINELKAQSNVNPTDMEVLQQYDKLAGRITYQGQTVKLGSFWDFAKNQPKAKPTPVIVKRREIVEEEMEMEVPLEMKEEKKKKD